MHERRNFILTLAFAIALGWAVVAWLFSAVFPSLAELPPSTDTHRYASLSATLMLAACLAYVHLLEDKMPDRLAHVGTGTYYEQDGVCFMPVFRVMKAAPTSSMGKTAPTSPSALPQAELSLYYQNRFEGECEVVVHIRPPKGAFYSHKGARDVHFAFRCQPGAFGVIHQPVAVGHEFQGACAEVQLAAMVRWVRHRGRALRSRCGERVGTFHVDWAQAYRLGKHELCGEIELKSPAVVRLTLPDNVAEHVQHTPFVNETLLTAPGV